MDRLLWCEECRGVARKRSGMWGWYIQPSDLVIGGWIATVVAALWIGARVGREIAYGVIRFNNQKAAEAVPPGSDA